MTCTLFSFFRPNSRFSFNSSFLRLCACRKTSLTPSNHIEKQRRKLFFSLSFFFFQILSHLQGECIKYGNATHIFSREYFRTTSLASSRNSTLEMQFSFVKTFQILYAISSVMSSAKRQWRRNSTFATRCILYVYVSMNIASAIAYTINIKMKITHIDLIL